MPITVANKGVGGGVTNARDCFSPAIQAKACALLIRGLTMEAKAAITPSFSMIVLATWGKRIGVGATSAKVSFSRGIRARGCALRANLMTQAKAARTNLSLDRW